MEFIKAQIDAGVKLQKEHYFGKEFADKKFAAMIEGSWLPSDLPKVEIVNVQFIPAFPVPDKKTETSTLMGAGNLACCNHKY
jgi:multiple sugar transport system substrate-binding protein